MTNLPGPRSKLTHHEYLGSCVRCRFGIYQGQPHHRGRGIWLGILCHDCHHDLTQAGAAR